MVSGERGSMAELTDRKKSCLTGLLEFFQSIAECGQRRSQYTTYLNFQKVFAKVICQRLLEKVGAFVKLVKQRT